MSGNFSCPHCGAAEDKWLGHQIDGVYDGVLYWSCQACGLAWSRDWTFNSFSPHRGQVAQRMVEEHNRDARRKS